MTWGYMNGMRPRGVILFEGKLEGDTLTGKSRLCKVTCSNAIHLYHVHSLAAFPAAFGQGALGRPSLPQRPIRDCDGHVPGFGQALK
jgi:hypothetical protein